MRLTCPNCGARYEVDDAMIPPEGRDVQCSSCSTTWFQTAKVLVSQPEEPEDNQRSETVFTADQQRAPRREIDPAVRDMLRQEAEREERLRREEAASSVETQDEMALEVTEKAPDRLRRELAETAENIHGVDDEGLGAAGYEGGTRPRSELLPDIEEINSTLRSTEERAGADMAASDFNAVELVPRRRRGLRFGFGLVVLAAVGMAMAYFRAGDLAELVPELAPSLSVYVEQVDILRVWLDETVQELVAAATSSQGG